VALAPIGGAILIRHHQNHQSICEKIGPHGAQRFSHSPDTVLQKKKVKEKDNNTSYTTIFSVFFFLFLRLVYPCVYLYYDSEMPID
jgi:hypothetical protein